MGRKKKKKATQKKKICTSQHEEDEIGIDCCSCDLHSCACNGEDSENQIESNVMDLEAVIANLKSKVEDQQILFNERESIYKDMISRMNGSINKYQILQDEVTSHSEGLEAEIISLKADLEKSNKKNEELLQTCEEK